MFVKKFNDCKEIIAADGTILRETLHPIRSNVKIDYSIAHAKVLPGKKSKIHSLAFSEVYYIIRGKGVMHIGNEFQKVKARDTIFIPPKTNQWIENTGKTVLEFLAIVNPAWELEAELGEQKN